MTYDYLITLKKRNDRLIDAVSVLMYVFALSVFAYYYRYEDETFYIFICGGVVLTLVIALARRRSTGEAFFSFGLLIAALGWFYEPHRNIVMSVLYLLSALLERQMKFSAEIGFSKERIVFNTFPRRTLRWDEVSNVLIRDGLLTIDQKNNRLFQKEIEGDVTRLEEEQFNLFCRQCINAAA